MISLDIIDEPLIEFGYAGTHQEQRAGLTEHGPADIEMDDRLEEIRVGIVGPAEDISELQQYLRNCASGVNGKETEFTTLFPDFPGFTPKRGFRCKLALPAAGRRVMSAQALAAIGDAHTEVDQIQIGVELCATEVRAAVSRAPLDVVLVIRPAGVPEGVPHGASKGANFHDLLKAELITTSQPIQIIRPRTWRGGKTVEDPASRAWNLFTALYYKAGGKPWRLRRERSALSRLYIGISFKHSGASDQLFATVAQVFNELGDGVIVRGAFAERSDVDLQPHLAREDAHTLLTDALARYRQEHGTAPAAVTVHKTSDYSAAELAGFQDAATAAQLHSCELIWLTGSDNAMLVRGPNYYPPLRGTLLTLDEHEHLLYTHGSIPFYKTYPGLYVPRPLGVRPRVVDRPVAEIASEILELTKLNWNRARLDGRLPITLLTAQRVGDILRHVDSSVTPAPRYANYM